MSAKKLISFIFPIYNEAETIPQLYVEVLKAIKPLEPTYDVELIFVNDGSKDDSISLLQDIQQVDTKVKVIGFAANAGHQIAVTAGQDYATGDAVIIMDSDLQDPPQVALELIKKWEEGNDIVYARRRSYKTHPVKKFYAFLFYRLLKKIASVDIPVDTGDFRLLSKRVNTEMKKYKEKSRYLRGMTSLMGYKHAFVEFDRGERFAGATNYPFKKSLKLALNGITGFSTFPLGLITTTGIGLAMLSFVGGFFYILISLSTNNNVSGWVSLMSVTLFVSGIQLFMLGIIGEYIGRIYTEVLDRPLYTIAVKKGFGEEPKETTVQRN